MLEEDPLLVGFDIAKYVFTDISYGIPGTTAGSIIRLEDVFTFQPRWGTETYTTILKILNKK